MGLGLGWVWVWGYGHGSLSHSEAYVVWAYITWVWLPHHITPHPNFSHLLYLLPEVLLPVTHVVLRSCFGAVALRLYVHKLLRFSQHLRARGLMVGQRKRTKQQQIEGLPQGRTLERPLSLCNELPKERNDCSSTLLESCYVGTHLCRDRVNFVRVCTRGHDAGARECVDGGQRHGLRSSGTWVRRVQEGRGGLGLC